MYFYILLSICSATAFLNTKDLRDFMANIISKTHDKFVSVDACLNISQLARKYGYPLQTHTVITQDGYILNFHRIPNNERKQRPIVFLMHGLLESSDSWVLMGPEKALAYLLADEGFDVWMGNARGNKHAQKHITLNNTIKEYWEFSWEEIALYDLPAMIDYILEETGYDSVYYVGYSQGTTVSYVLCSMKPEYNQKINMIFSLAPEAWMGHVKSPIIRMFSPAHNLLSRILKNFNAYSANNVFNQISAFVCSVVTRKCENMLYLLAGYGSKIHETFLPVILGHTPSGSSMKQFVHYGQLVQSQRFCRYDFGKLQNMNKYGAKVPPDYDLKYVTAPVMIFYGSQDWVSDKEDVAILMENLRNVNESIFLEDFTHLDYLYATDAVDAIYGRIVNKINEFENHNQE